MIVLILAGIFIVLVFAIGGDRTAKSLITLLGNALIIIMVIAAIYLGANILFVIVAACAAISSITLFYQNEINAKTKAAFLSTVVVSVAMTALIIFFVYRGHLQGMSGTSMHTIREMNGYSGDIGINMLFLQAAVILIALLGAVIDTSLSIASGSFEVSRHNPDLSRKAMFLSGLNIGGEILNSTVNTLFFIFMGEFLVMFVNFALYFPVDIMINSKEFAQGAICIMISAAGCVIVIPITAFISALFFKRQSHK